MILCYLSSPGLICDQEDHCASMPCRNGGTCTPNANGFECACLAGYRGVTCMEDVDECAEDNRTCLNGGVCRNRYGSYKWVIFHVLFI